jgi:hypothetical protein
MAVEGTTGFLVPWRISATTFLSRRSENVLERQGLAPAPKHSPKNHLAGVHATPHGGDGRYRFLHRLTGHSSESQTASSSYGSVILFPVEVLVLGWRRGLCSVEIVAGRQFGQRPSLLRLCLSHFRTRNTTSRWIGPSLGGFLANAPCACIPPLATAAAASRLMTPDHDWITVRRGRCKPCHQTFTFLPPFTRSRTPTTA